MKVLLKNVDIGSEYDDKVYDYWIVGQLNSGKQIEIFDAAPFDLRKYESKTIECLIVATFVEVVYNSDNVDEIIINGTFLGKYSLDDKWENISEGGNKIYELVSEWYAIKTDDGIFLLTLSKKELNSMKEGDIIFLKVGRYDLLAWYPID
ncbi:MAG: hypothetical protein ACFFDK_19035 [Promethearchaeota archaeon]